MRATRSEFSQKPFVMTEDDLRALAELAAKIGKPEYAIACSDGLSRQFTSLDDLVKFDNSPSRSIIRLTVSASTREPTFSSLKLSFGDEPYTNFQIHLDSPDPLIVDLNRDLEARLAAMSPWYAILTRGDIFLLGLGSLLAVALIFAALLGFGIVGNQPSSPPSDPRRDLQATAIAWGIVVAWGLLAWVLSVVRVRLFPIGAFVVGAGRSRYDVLEKIRWTVVAGFLVSVVASLVVRWFA